MHSPVDLAELDRTYRDHIAWLAAEYARVLPATGFDAVVIHSGTPKSRSMFDDQYWPLRATPHFQHWLPLETANSALVMRPGKKPRLVWNNGYGFWEAPAPPETDHFWPSFDVVEVKDATKLKDELQLTGKAAFIGEDLNDAATWGFTADRINPKTLLAELDRLRVLKTPYELLCLREANRRAGLGHAKVIDAFQRGDHSELQLHLMYLEATAQDDAETPYKNIVALGEHAATLHHVSYGKTRSSAQSLLLDAGASYQGYDSDITRTVMKGKASASDVFAGLIAKMETLQQETCRRVKLGMPYQDLHDQSHQLLAPVLRDLGIASGSDAELVDTGVTRTFLPHGLGHSLGLQTHDVGCAAIKPDPKNPFLRNTTKVAAGQVFTIEPGCYFITSLLDELKAKPQGKLVNWSLVDELKKFGGVRIEDDLAIGTARIENFTREFLAN